jgi:hypothetical protein
MRVAAVAHQEKRLGVRENGPRPFEPLGVGLDAVGRTIKLSAVAQRRHRGDTHRLN